MYNAALCFSTKYVRGVASIPRWKRAHSAREELSHAQVAQDGRSDLIAAFVSKSKELPQMEQPVAHTGKSSLKSTFMAGGSLLTIYA